MTSNLPTGWKVEPIGKCTQIALSNVDKKSVIDEQQVELCNYMDVYRNTKITAEIDFMVATASISQIEKFGIQRGDVMITKDSEDPKDIAVPSVVSEDFSGNVVCGYHLALLRPGTGILGDFLAWSLRSYFVNNQFTRRANGATRFGITSSVIQSTKLLLPPLPEQRKIAEILSSVDEAIGVTQAVIEQTRRVKEGLLQELLTKGIGHTRFKKTAIGEIPESWEFQRLSQVAQFTTGKLDSNAAVRGGEYPFFTCAKETSEIASYSFDQEALLLAGNNAKGEYSVKYYKGKFDAYQRTYVIGVDLKKVSYRFLQHALQSQLRVLTRLSTGSATKFLTIKVLHRLGVALPSPSEQAQITSILDKADELLVDGQASLVGHKKVKAGLLQDLLTGKVRVSV